MSEQLRVCQRAGCQQPATVTLSFRYDARQASLIDLSIDKDPAYYDLCAFHADLLIVPRGWERLDRRTPPPEPEPELAAPAAGAMASDPALDRYAALTAELPRLAEACGVAQTPTATIEAPSVHERSTRTPMRPSTVDGAVPGQFLAARPDALAPDRARADADTADHPYEPVTRTLLDEDVFELEGQLQMPIEPEPRGVVVALTRTRNT